MLQLDADSRALHSFPTRRSSDLLRPSSGPRPELSRTEQYMSFKMVFVLIGVMFLLMCALYVHISGLWWPAILAAVVMRSEEHTSELQSRGQLVCRLLLEKKQR